MLCFNMPLPSKLPSSLGRTAVEEQSRVLAKRYEVDRKLGAGNFGTAYLIRDTGVEDSDGRKLKVLKQICVGSLNPGESVDAMREANLLSALKHRNIVQFHDSFLDGQFFCIVTEYCEGGDLEVKLDHCRKNNITVEESQVKKWLKQLLKALRYMHEKRVLHRDLKTRNIFVKDNRMKIGDFGISRILMGTSDMASTFVGTPFYMSPEVLKHEQYDERCDIWSLGCVLYEICCLKHAFDGQSLMSVMFKIVSGENPQLPDTYSRGLNNVLECMLNRNLQERKNAAQLLTHNAFGKSSSNMTPREMLQMRKQIRVNETIKMHSELAAKNLKDNEIRHKEAIDKNFHQTSIDVLSEKRRKKPSKNMKKVELHEKKAKPDEKKREMTGKSIKKSLPTISYQPTNGKENTNHATILNEPRDVKTGMNADDHVVDNSDLDNNHTLRSSSEIIPFDGETTQELIESLIRDGLVPEDALVAESYYSMHDDFEAVSEEEDDIFTDDELLLPDDNLHMSDSEYKEMLGCMEEALNLEATTISKTLKPEVVDTEQTLKPGKADNNVTSAFTSGVIENQISNIRKKCEQAIGKQAFDRAHDLLKERWLENADLQTSNFSQVISELREIIPESNKCFLLEQLIYLEIEKTKQVA